MLKEKYKTSAEGGSAPEARPGLLFNLSAFCDDLASLAHAISKMLSHADVVANWCADDGIRLNLKKLYLLAFNPHLAPKDESDKLLSLMQSPKGLEIKLRSEVEIAAADLQGVDESVCNVPFSFQAKCLGYVLSPTKGAHETDRTCKARVSLDRLTEAGVGLGSVRSWQFRSTALKSVSIPTLVYAVHLTSLDPNSLGFKKIRATWKSLVADTFGLRRYLGTVFVPLLAWSVGVKAASDLIYRNGATELGRIIRGFKFSVIYRQTVWLLCNQKASWQWDIWTSSIGKFARSVTKGSLEQTTRLSWKAAVERALNERNLTRMKALTCNSGQVSATSRLLRFLCPDKVKDLATPPVVFNKLSLSVQDKTLLLALRLGSWRHSYEGKCNGMGHRCVLCAAPGKLSPRVSTVHLFCCPQPAVLGLVAPLFIDCVDLFSDLNTTFGGPKLKSSNLPLLQWLAFCLGALPSVVRCGQNSCGTKPIDIEKLSKLFTKYNWPKMWRALVCRTLEVARKLLQLQVAGCGSIPATSGK